MEPHPDHPDADTGGRPRPTTLVARASLTYVFDAQCPWSWSVTPELRRVAERIPGASIDLIHGRLFPSGGRTFTEVEWFEPTARSVADLTGTALGDRFREACRAGLTADSDRAARVFVALRSIAPDLALDVAGEMHRSVLHDGDDLADRAAVDRLADRVGIAPDRVRAMLANPLVARLAALEQRRAVALGASVHPALYVMAPDRTVALRTRLQSAAQLLGAIDAVLTNG